MKLSILLKLGMALTTFGAVTCGLGDLKAYADEPVQPTAAPAEAIEEILPFQSFACSIRTLEDGEGNPIRVPATIGTTSEAETVVYYWVRDYYPETAETSLEICDRVSATFDTLNSEGLLGSISSGITRGGTPAICAGQTCSRPIFTLLPDEDPTLVLADLFLALTTESTTDDNASAVSRGDNEPTESMRSYSPPLDGLSSRSRRTGGGVR